MERRVIIIILLALGLAMGASAKKKQQVEPSFAWALTEPLGLRTESTIDTLFVDYHRYALPWGPSHVWATTGNYGAPGQEQLFFNRPITSEFFHEDALQPWLHNTATMRYFNTRIPMTLLGYTTGGDKRSNQDRTQALFSGNVNKRLQVGAAMDYIYSKGSYDNQADKDFTWKVFGSYMGDRYELQTFFTHFEYTTRENGGITDDRFITDPAEVQGGQTSVDNKSITTLLTDAQSSVKGSQFYMNHRYKVGFYRYQRDSITDTIIGRTYVPVTSFIWTLDYKDNRHRFNNDNAMEDTLFFDNTYLKLGGTDEQNKWWRLRNTVGISMLEGFNKWAKFGLAAFATHEIRRYTQITDTITKAGTELPKGLDVAPASISPKHTDNVVWVGGQLTKQQGSHLRYQATARFGVLGSAAGDIDITGDIETRLKIRGDTATLRGYGYFKNLETPYLLNNFVSNHYIWQNDFGKTQRFRVGGELNIPQTWTNINVGYETIKNYVYFGDEGLPIQHTSGIHVLSATLRQGLHFKAFGWENSVTYQTSSEKTVLPLPALSIYSNIYANFVIAKVLNVQVGIDGNYYTKYYAPTYNPATMTFHTQHEKECGNFLLANLYANFKLKKARFFIVYTHANGKIFGGNDYFAIPHYPLNPRRFQVGVSVDFVN